MRLSFRMLDTEESGRVTRDQLAKIVDRCVSLCVSVCRWLSLCLCLCVSDVDCVCCVCRALSDRSAEERAAVLRTVASHSLQLFHFLLTRSYSLFYMQALKSDAQADAVYLDGFCALLSSNDALLAFFQRVLSPAASTAADTQTLTGLSPSARASASASASASPKARKRVGAAASGSVGASDIEHDRRLKTEQLNI